MLMTVTERVVGFLAFSQKKNTLGPDKGIFLPSEYYLKQNAGGFKGPKPEGEGCVGGNFQVSKVDF